MEDFQCPINHTLMQDPVVAPDGWSYERSAIEGWIRTHGVSPITREPLALHQLVPNISLRRAIEQHKIDHPELVAEAEAASPAPQAAVSTRATATAPVAAIAAAPERNAGPSLDVHRFEHHDDMYLQVSMQLPERTPAERKNAFVVAMVDISGSMNSSVNPGNDEESMFSRLDLVKHTLKTFITCLGPQDFFSIIVYDDVAEVNVAPTLLTDANKEVVKVAIENLHPRGSTNIWSALLQAMQLVKSSNVDTELYNVGCFLLTDGQSNRDPPRGIIPTLQHTLEQRPISYAINTFGYGYSIDSPLLIEIANLTNGAYGFIPDASMVGTVFVNALANLLAAGAVKTDLHLERMEGADCEVLGYIPQGPRQTITNGSLAFGGRCSYLLRLPKDVDTSRVFRLDAKLDRLLMTHEFSIAECPPAEPAVFYGELARVQMMRAVQFAQDQAKERDVGAAARELRKLQATLQGGEGQDFEWVQAVVRDLDSPLDNEGQLCKALGDQKWYQKWGRHYAPHFLNAHSLQHCLNFKDQSLQQFGGSLFQSIQRVFEDAFISLPAPTPSLTVRENVHVPVTMAGYYNYGGGCFLGSGQVQKLEHASNSVRSTLVENVRRGDRVLASTATQTYGTVRCVVRMLVEEPMQFVDMNGLVITHWHPVLQNGRWVFPANLPDKFERVSGLPNELTSKSMNGATSTSDHFVYDFVLEEDSNQHSVVINGTEAITLGHGVQDSVASHAYLGTQAVINDLAKLPGWQDGLVTLRPSQYLRDSSNKICGIAPL